MADAQPERFYQTVNFHFKVDFNFDPKDGVDVRFQSVTGLDSNLDTETIKEGGENPPEHVLPVRRKYGPLTLKRGLLKPNDSKLTNRLKETFDGNIVKHVRALNILLLDE